MMAIIRVDDQTKARLERLKGEDETWSEFLDRLASERGSMEPGLWTGTDKPEGARDARERAREGFE